jgi:site-specific DNA-methyltransferase (adenine-specific)
VLGDCLTVLPLLPDNSVDLVIADPPYNLDKRFGETEWRKTDAEAYQDFTRLWLTEVLRILKPDGSLYICTDWTSGMILGPMLAEAAVLRNRITWQREKGRGAARNWKNGMEDIWFATRSEEYTFHLDAVRLRRRVLAPYRADGVPKDWENTPDGKFRDTCPSNFWDDITVPFWSMKENTAHPTQKPEKLMAKLILASSDPGDVILDPFAGSGSACVAAKKLGRRFIGIERERTYCCWCEKRLADAEEDKRIQGYEDGIFWERNAQK